MEGWRYWPIIALWVIWESYWIGTAWTTKRATAKEPLLSRIPIVIGIVLAASLLLAPFWFGGLVNEIIVPQGDATYFGGLLVTLGGIGFAFWARFALGRNWSGRVTIKEDHELVTTGPYRFVRHPIYTGALLAFTGTTLAFGRVGGLFAFAIMLAIFLRKISLEEKMLNAHFGERYAEYSRRTKSIIPLIW
ncbi:MAG: methyltransferase family protein [Bacillota bacterium]